MVFSDTFKEVLKSIESEGLRFKKIITTAPPRMDYLKNLFESDFFYSQADNKSDIVIFSYINGNYRDNEKNSWEILRKIYSYPLLNKKSIIIKCKSRGDKPLLKKERLNY